MTPAEALRRWGRHRLRCPRKYLTPEQIERLRPDAPPCDPASCGLDAEVARLERAVVLEGTPAYITEVLLLAKPQPGDRVTVLILPAPDA